MRAMGTTLEALLFQLERELQGITTRLDAVRLSQLLADDFVEFGVSGNVWGSKAQVIAGLRDEVFSECLMTEFALNLLSNGVALVTYRCHREAWEIHCAVRCGERRKGSGGWCFIRAHLLRPYNTLWRGSLLPPGSEAAQVPLSRILG